MTNVAQKRPRQAILVAQCRRCSLLASPGRSSSLRCGCSTWTCDVAPAEGCQDRGRPTFALRLQVRSPFGNKSLPAERGAVDSRGETRSKVADRTNLPATTAKLPFWDHLPPGSPSPTSLSFSPPEEANCEDTGAVPFSRLASVSTALISVRASVGNCVRFTPSSSTRRP